MTNPMTSTDLAHALAIPLDTPGCWGHRYFDAPGRLETVCLWPLPDSGLPGAELWTYWLMRALVGTCCKAHFTLNFYRGSEFGDWYAQGLDGNGSSGLNATHGAGPVAALYAAWKEQKNG